MEGLFWGLAIVSAIGLIQGVLMAVSNEYKKARQQKKLAQEVGATIISAAHRLTQPFDVVERSIADTCDKHYIIYGKFPSFEFWQEWIPRQLWSDQVKADQLQNMEDVRRTNPDFFDTRLRSRTPEQRMHEVLIDRQRHQQQWRTK
jgi:hypothetical protein